MININYEPSIPQSRVWDAWDDPVSTSILTGGGVNSGKSYNLCALFTIKAVMYPETRYFLGRKKLTTLMNTTVKTLWKVFRDFGFVADVHYSYNGNSRTITLFNGSEIMFDHLTFEPSDEEIARLGGLELTAAGVDEANECEYKMIEKLHERVGRWNNSRYGIKPIVIMTCNPSRGWLKKKYYDLHVKGELPEWKFVSLSTVRDNPHASEAYVKNLINVLTQQERERQVDGSWEFGDNPDQLTTYENAEAMYYHPLKPGDLKGKRYITADIAFASDRCVIGVWDDWTLIHIRVLKDGEKPEDVIKQLQISFNVSGKNVAYDSTGSGFYLKNYISGAYAFHAGATPLKDKDTKQKTYEHLKTQMYCHAAGKINDGTMKVLTEELRDDLLEEMTMIRSIPKERIDSVVKLISKDEIKKLIGRSPDILDMVSMRGVFDFKIEWKSNF